MHSSVAIMSESRPLGKKLVHSRELRRYICGGAIRSRTSVPLCSLKFFFLAVMTVVAGGLLRTQFSFSPSIPIAPLESSCRFDFGSFRPFRIAVCAAAPELASEVIAEFPVRCVGSLERFIE